MADKNVDIKIKATDEASSVFQKVAQNAKAAMGGAGGGAQSGSSGGGSGTGGGGGNLFSRLGSINNSKGLGNMLSGAGLPVLIAGLYAMGHALAGVTQAAVAYEDAMQGSNVNMYAFNRKLAESIPIFGGFAKAGYAIHEMWTHDRLKNKMGILSSGAAVSIAQKTGDVNAQVISSRLNNQQYIASQQRQAHVASLFGYQRQVASINAQDADAKQAMLAKTKTARIAGQKYSQQATAGIDAQIQKLRTLAGGVKHGGDGIGADIMSTSGVGAAYEAHENAARNQLHAKYEREITALKQQRGLLAAKVRARVEQMEKHPKEQYDAHHAALMAQKKHLLAVEKFSRDQYQSQHRAQLAMVEGQTRSTLLAAHGHARQARAAQASAQHQASMDQAAQQEALLERQYGKQKWIIADYHQQVKASTQRYHAQIASFDRTFNIQLTEQTQTAYAQRAQTMAEGNAQMLRENGQAGQASLLLIRSNYAEKVKIWRAEDAAYAKLHKAGAAAHRIATDAKIGAAHVQALQAEHQARMQNMQRSQGISMELRQGKIATLRNESLMGNQTAGLQAAKLQVKQQFASQIHQMVMLAHSQYASIAQKRQAMRQATVLTSEEKVQESRAGLIGQQVANPQAQYSHHLTGVGQRSEEEHSPLIQMIKYQQQQVNLLKQIAGHTKNGAKKPHLAPANIGNH